MPRLSRWERWHGVSRDGEARPCKNNRILKEHTHAGEYLFAQRHPDRAGAWLYLRSGGAGTVSELFHPEHRRPVHRRLLYPGLCGGLSGSTDRPPHSGPCGGHGGGRVLRLCHCVFADPLGVESIMAGIIVNTGLYTINLAAMGFSSTMSLVKTETSSRWPKSRWAFWAAGTSWCWWG